MAYIGKFEQQNTRGRKSKRLYMLGLSLVLLLTLAVGGTLAYIVTNSAMVKNQFVPGKVASRVNISGDKIDVTNTDSNTDAYIRASVVVNWMNKDGHIRGIAPQATDYALTINADRTWTGTSPWYYDSASGFYYYKRSVAALETTDDLITSITTEVTPPTGYSLSVEVIAEAIQAAGVKDGNGVKAVADAWNVTFFG